MTLSSVVSASLIRARIATADRPSSRCPSPVVPVLRQPCFLQSGGEHLSSPRHPDREPSSHPDGHRRPSPDTDDRPVHRARDDASSTPGRTGRRYLVAVAEPDEVMSQATAAAFGCGARAARDRARHPAGRTLGRRALGAPPEPLLAGPRHRRGVRRARLVGRQRRPPAPRRPAVPRLDGVRRGGRLPRTARAGDPGCAARHEQRRVRAWRRRSACSSPVRSPRCRRCGSTAHRPAG